MDKLFSFFDIKITIRLSTLVAILLLAYLVWESYWYMQVGPAFVRWHTHLMPYVFLGFIFALAGRALYRKAPSDRVKNILLASVMVLFSLFIAEAFLMVSGINKTYMEKVSGFYVSPYTPQDKDYYHVWTRRKEHWLTKPEYSYWRPTNSAGFADFEWSPATTPHEKRIMALGDSFTEGDGAPYDSSYVAIMRQELRLSGDSFYVMNGGVCGSDPVNNFIILKDLLQPYQPDLIIQSLGSGDMDADIAIRGGVERFQKDSTQKYRPGPWWEPIYAGSYISRTLFAMAGYTELLRKKILAPDERERIDHDLIDVFKQYDDLCHQRGMRLVVVLHPQLEEIQHERYNYDFSAVLAHLRTDDRITVIDLLPSYKAYIEKSHTEPADYFWKQDGHHNSKGYKMMAETTLQNIKPWLMDSTASDK